ncbi:MAG: hypothetical protein AAB425_04870, partial [Bdellovibrionota bacterium]
PPQMVIVSPGWKEVRSRVLAPYCLKCHDQGKREPYLNTRADCAKALSAIRTTVFETKTMPKGNKKPTPEELKILEDWLNAGGPVDPVFAPAPVQPTPMATPITCPPVLEPIVIISPSPVPAPTSPVTDRPVRWDQVWSKVLQPKCQSCHEGEDPIGKIDLTHKETIRIEYMAFILQMAVITNDMPPPDEGPPLTKEEKQLLVDWVVDGMQD